jgi:H+-translocating NAD(P) transhydrogenase subunit alpha
MKVGLVKERAPNERRVALTPDALKPLLGAGVEVLVEKGAGDGAAIPDQAYTDAGAKVVSRDDVYAQRPAADGDARRKESDGDQP